MKRISSTITRRMIMALVAILMIMASLSLWPVHGAEAPFTVTAGDTPCAVSIDGTTTDPFEDTTELYCCTVPAGTTKVTVETPNNWYTANHDNWGENTQNKLTVVKSPENCAWVIDNDEFLFYGIYFKEAAPSTEKTTLSLELSAQQEDTFLVPHKTVTVTEGLAEEYGYHNDATHIQTGEVSTLDALVATHIELFGSDFTKATATDYLAVTDTGIITKIFATDTTAVGFTVNGKMPNDGVLGNYGYTGYTVNQAALSQNDDVEFFTYQDTAFYTDYYAYFTQDGQSTKDLNTQAGKPTTLKIMGYMAMDGFSETPLIKGLSDIEISLLDENGNPLTLEGFTGGVTDENGEVTLTFPTQGTYTLSAKASPDSAVFIVNPWCTMTVTKGYNQTGYLGDATDAVVYDDFENDLWLQDNFKELSQGETAEIYPRRLPQMVSGSTTAEVTRPNFHFEIIRGDSITLDTTQSTEKAKVKAVKAGDTVVKVTYDAQDAYGKTYGASSPVNTAYVIYSVDGEAGITLNTSIDTTSYDTLYYTQGATRDLDFTVKSTGAKTLEVTCNGLPLLPENQSYRAPLENRSNIIAVVATDDQGRTRSHYQVVDARKIEMTVTNATREGKNLEVGDTAKISFRGIVHPVYKLATIYNPTWHDENYGSKGTYVHYDNDTLGQIKGYCGQWDLATRNTVTLELNQAGNFTFDGGKIYSMWWGKALGYDKTLQGVGEPGLHDPTHEGEFSSLPAFTLSVTDPNAKPEEPKPSPSTPAPSTPAPSTPSTDNGGQAGALKPSTTPSTTTAKTETQGQKAETGTSVKTGVMRSEMGVVMVIAIALVSAAAIIIGVSVKCSRKHQK